MFNKAWYYQNRGTNIKSHAHTTEFHLQNVPPGGLRENPTQACGLGGQRRRGGGQRGSAEEGETKNSPYKGSKRARPWRYHNDTGTNKNKNRRTQADTAGYAAKNQDGRPSRGVPGGPPLPAISCHLLLARSLSRALSHSLSLSLENTEGTLCLELVTLVKRVLRGIAEGGTGLDLLKQQTKGLLPAGGRLGFQSPGGRQAPLGQLGASGGLVLCHHATQDGRRQFGAGRALGRPLVLQEFFVFL